jgi:hypothetical protein
MKPKKAITVAQQCLAFGKDHRRCRLVREANSKTCRIHRKYYVDWLINHPTSIPFLDLTERQTAEYLFQIEGRYVEIPSWYLETVTPQQIIYFPILIKSTHHSPMINVRVFANYIHLIYAKYTTEEMFKRIKHCMKDVESVLFILDGLIYEIMTHLPSPWMISDTDTLVSVSYRQLQNMTQRPLWRQILFATEDIQECFDTNRKSLQVYFVENPELIPVFEEFFSESAIHNFCHDLYKYHISFIKARCAIYREELMSVAWHPDRIERWLNQGLITLESLDDL